MATILDTTQAKVWVWLHLVEYGYSEAPEISLLMYDLASLNVKDIDFRWLKLKWVAGRVSTSESWESVVWKEEDIKEALITVATATSATEVIVDVSGVIVWEVLYNQTTKETALVVAVSGTTLTLETPGFLTANGYAVGNKIVRSSFSKKYWVDHGHRVGRNALTDYSNYIQFTEEQIDSDMIQNNKNYLFTSNDDRNKIIFSDASKKIIKGICSSFYTGKKFKTNTSGAYQYGAWGLNEFIPAWAKVNVKGIDKEATKANLRLQLQRAYQSGLKGIYGANKLLGFCTTKWAAEIDDLYESKVLYNDELKAVNIQIKQYNVGWFKMNMVVSNLLDYDMWDIAMMYLVPIDNVFTFMLPRAAVNEDGKTSQMVGRGIVYKKPQTTIELSTIALATNFSFVFEGIGSGAYRRLTIA